MDAAILDNRKAKRKTALFNSEDVLKRNGRADGAYFKLLLQPENIAVDLEIRLVAQLNESSTLFVSSNSIKLSTLATDNEALKSAERSFDSDHKIYSPGDARIILDPSAENADGQPSPSINRLHSSNGMQVEVENNNALTTTTSSGAVAPIVTVSYPQLSLQIQQQPQNSSIDSALANQFIQQEPPATPDIFTSPMLTSRLQHGLSLRTPTSTPDLTSQRNALQSSNGFQSPTPMMISTPQPFPTTPNNVANAMSSFQTNLSENGTNNLPRFRSITPLDNLTQTPSNKHLDAVKVFLNIAPSTNNNNSTTNINSNTNATTTTSTTTAMNINSNLPNSVSSNNLSQQQNDFRVVFNPKQGDQTHISAWQLTPTNVAQDQYMTSVTIADYLPNLSLKQARELSKVEYEVLVASGDGFIPGHHSFTMCLVDDINNVENNNNIKLRESGSTLIAPSPSLNNSSSMIPEPSNNNNTTTSVEPPSKRVKLTDSSTSISSSSSFTNASNGFDLSMVDINPISQSMTKFAPFPTTVSVLGTGAYSTVRKVLIAGEHFACKNE